MPSSSDPLRLHLSQVPEPVLPPRTWENLHHLLTFIGRTPVPVLRAIAVGKILKETKKDRTEPTRPFVIFVHTGWLLEWCKSRPVLCPFLVMGLAKLEYLFASLRLPQPFVQQPSNPSTNAIARGVLWLAEVL